VNSCPNLDTRESAHTSPGASRRRGEGAKLEQQVVIDDSGPELLTDYSLELR